MQPLRFNGFSMIHKALRSMLYEAAMALQQTDFTNRPEALAAFGKVDRILELFDDHADHEDFHILSPLKDTNGGLASDFEKEHVTDRALCADLRAAIMDYEQATIPSEMIEAGNKVFFAFNEFIAFNLRHMNKEETILNKALWEKYSDGEIMQINQRIASSVAPDKAIENVTWMMRSCNDMELTMFIKSIKTGAPEPLVNLLYQVAGKELPADRWEQIRQKAEEQAPT